MPRSYAGPAPLVLALGLRERGLTVELLELLDVRPADPLARHALKQVDELVLCQPSAVREDEPAAPLVDDVGHGSGRRIHASATARHHLQPYPAPVGCRLGKVAELLGGSVPLDEHVGADHASLGDVDEVGRGEISGIRIGL